MRGKAPRAPGSPFTSHGIRGSRSARGGLLAFRILETGYLPNGTSWHFPNVRSPFWRLYYNGAPGWHVRHGSGTFALAPDRLLIIADNTLFHCCGERGIPHLWVHFTPPAESSVELQAPHALPLDQPLRCTVEELLAASCSAPGAQLGHAAAALLHMTFARLEHAPAPEYPPGLRNCCSSSREIPPPISRTSNSRERPR
jgi:hypothetical protein